jgi:hypothetical protein
MPQQHVAPCAAPSPNTRDFPPLLRIPRSRGSSGYGLPQPDGPGLLAPFPFVARALRRNAFLSEFRFRGIEEGRTMSYNGSDRHRKQK